VNVHAACLIIFLIPNASSAPVLLLYFIYFIFFGNTRYTRHTVPILTPQAAARLGFSGGW